MPYNFDRHDGGVVIDFKGTVIPSEIIEATVLTTKLPQKDLQWTVWNYGDIAEDTQKFWPEYLVIELANAIDGMYAHVTWPHRFPHVAKSDRIRLLCSTYFHVTTRPASHEGRVFDNRADALAWATEAYVR